MPQVHSCMICHAPGEGYFFDVFSCRCCAAFFRRSIKEGKEYICRAQNDCPINEDGMRNSCRACRFKRCIQMGMTTKTAEGRTRIGQKRKRHIQIVNSSTSSSSSAVSPILPQSQYEILQQNQQNSSIIIKHFGNSPFPMSQKIAKEISIFKGSIRAICVQHLGLDVFLGDTLRRVTHNETAMLDRISAPIYLEFVKSELPEFGHIFTKEQKTRIMHDFICHFGFFHILEMTMEKFPDHENLTELIFYPGLVFDLTNDESYDAVGIGADEQKKMAKNLSNFILTMTVNRYKPLGVSQMEFSAMVGIILWNCVNRVSENRFESKLNALFEELHSLVSHQCQNNSGPNFYSVPIRFGKLMLLIWDLTNKVDKDFTEMVSLSKVFLDKHSRLDYTNIWENIV